MFLTLCRKVMWSELFVSVLGIYEEGFGHCEPSKSSHREWNTENRAGTLRYLGSMAPQG
jgi:hypothetical protein